MKKLLVAVNGLLLLAGVLVIGSFMNNPASASGMDAQNKSTKHMMMADNTMAHNTVRHRRHRRHRRHHRRHRRMHKNANTM